MKGTFYPSELKRDSRGGLLGLGSAILTLLLFTAVAVPAALSGGERVWFWILAAADLGFAAWYAAMLRAAGRRGIYLTEDGFLEQSLHAKGHLYREIGCILAVKKTCMVRGRPAPVFRRARREGKRVREPVYLLLLMSGEACGYQTLHARWIASLDSGSLNLDPSVEEHCIGRALYSRELLETLRKRAPQAYLECCAGMDV